MQFNVVSGREFYRPFNRFVKELPDDYIGTMSKVQDKHGDLVHWRIYGGLVNFAFISDAATNRELFVRNIDALKKSSSQIQTFLYAAGHTVATAHGDDWRKKRKEANILFSRKIVEAPCAGQIAVVRNHIATLGTAPQDAIILARRLAAITSNRGILGHEISVAQADKQITFSKAASERFNAESGHMFARPNWMLAPWRRELTRRKKEVFPFVQDAIDRLRRTDAPNDGLMNHYINGDFTTSNDEEMLAILIGLLMGAQDNIAAATAWILAFLAHHPDLQNQIRDETANVGSEMRDLHNCRLLKATIFEALRLCPPAPANQPRVLQNKINIAGHVLPKGTFIFNSFYNMHLNPSHFANPRVFDPSRFLDGHLERATSFVPFGHGPRNCVAKNMALQQMSVIIVGILREYKIKEQNGTFPEITQKPFLVPAPFNVTLMKAIRAKLERPL